MKKVLISMFIVSLVFTPVMAKAEDTPVSSQTQTKAGVKNEIQQKIQELKTAKESEKSKLKVQILEKTKERAERSIDQAVKKYEKALARINNMTVISEERKTEITEKINAEIIKIRAMKSQVRSATTVEEVREIMTKLKTQMRESYNVVKEAVKAIHATHLENVAKKLEAIFATLETKMGLNKTEEMTKLTADAKKYLETAKTEITENDFKEAKNQILAARKTLVQLAQKVKATETTNNSEEE